MTETRCITDLRAHPLSAEVYGLPDVPPDFVQSIADVGILTPLSILPDGTIISGHRRWQAAKKLGLADVPVRVQELADALDIERAVIESNRQREKTFSQKMREAEHLERIEKARAKERQGKRIDLLGQETSVPSGTEVERSDQKVAEQVGLGSKSTYRRAKKVWEAAKSGDEQAQELVKRLDSEETTITGAARVLDKQTSKPHVSQNSGENEWYTPTKYIQSARKTMGAIDCDPASSDAANEVVKASTYYTIDDDGLQREWHGRVWMNPPYSQPLIKHFCERLVAQLDNNITQACVLVNNATDTAWFHTLLDSAAAVCFIKGRVRFLDREGNPTGAPLQGQAVLYFGENVAGFAEHFGQFGRVLYATR